MKDGLYQVTTNYLCAGFVVKDGKIVHKTMNREILFRAKRIDNAEWEFGYIFKISEMWYLETGEGYCHKAFPSTIGQFTGLTDKHGKKIFEGDIVTVEYGKGKVIFHAGCFMIEWIDDPESNMELLSIRDYKSGRPREDIEIIGNLHDNPESR